MLTERKIDASLSLLKGKCFFRRRNFSLNIELPTFKNLVWYVHCSTSTSFFSRDNFHQINNSIVDALLLEAVERDDLESIESILSWRNVKAKSLGN